MDTDPADVAKGAIERALAINDPGERARVITAILKVVDDANLAAVRQADVRILRETQTLREVAEKIHLSIGRVDQISKATVTGRRAKKAAVGLDE
jgi:hypothetical protein